MLRRSNTPFIIPKNIYDEMISHCEDGRPNEVCGILAGRGNEVSKLYKIRNVDNSPVSYLMDSKEQFRVMRELSQEGLSIVGLYHSHPSSAPYPSGKDVELAFYEDCVYVIVSLSESEPRAKAFFIKNGAVEEIETGQE